MKISIEIDCSPEEARTALGLPDIAALQEKLGGELAERMSAFVREADPEVLLRTWMPGGGTEGWERLQKSFWSGFTGGAAPKGE